MSFSCSPDSQLLATGGTELQLWDVDAVRTGSAEPLATFNRQHVRELTFNADGTLLFVSEPRRVTMWGIGE
jgi:hypothetical protein